VKLVELFAGIKALQKLSPDELIKELLSRGFLKKELGRGSKGIAFELTDGTVLKAWVSDPAYESWIQYAAKYPSPFFVKVLSPVKKFKAAEFELKYVRLEKLKPFKPTRWEGVHLNDTLVELVNYLDEVRYPPFEPAKDILIHELGFDQPVNKKWVAFTSAIVEIAEQLMLEGYRLDTGGNNLGTRDGKNPVIIDALHADWDYFPELIDVNQYLKKKELA
jgi:hypothetical protein